MQTEEQAARATMQHLDTGARNAILGRAPLRTDAERTLTFAGLMTDGTLSALGQACRDGWTCEDCDTWHPANEPHYSAADCNTTGRGVSLCKECVSGHEPSPCAHTESETPADGHGSFCHHCGETLA